MNMGDFATTKSIYSLPKDVMLDIFTRLATKSVGILACVSKFFNSLVTDPLFTTLHYTRWLADSDGPTILLSFPWFSNSPTNYRSAAPAVFYTLDFPDSCSRAIISAKHVLFMEKERFRDHHPRSFAHGTVCTCSPIGDVALCHLSTGQHISLPPPDTHHNVPDYCYSSCCALLGFDSVSKRYKVVKSMLYQLQHSVLIWKHWVFTVGVDKSWRETVVNFYPATAFQGTDSYNACVHIDGVIYTLSWHTPSLFDIMAFDVIQESFEAISRPEGWFDYNIIFDSKNLSLVEFNGGVAIVRVLISVDIMGRRYNDVVIWALDKDNGSRKWKKHCIHIPLPWYNHKMLENEWVMSVTTTRRGEIVFLLPCRMEVWILLDKFDTQLLSFHKICGVVHRYASEPFVIEPNRNYVIPGISWNLFP